MAERRVDRAATATEAVVAVVGAGTRLRDALGDRWDGTAVATEPGAATAARALVVVDCTDGTAVAAEATRPVVAVGTGRDTAALYDAGVLEVVPLDPVTATEAVADRVAAVADRERERQTATATAATGTAGTVVHDPETGAVRAADDTVREILGYDSGAEVTLSTFTDAATAFDRAAAVSSVRAAADGEPQTFEWRNTTPGGEVWVSVRLESATVAGRPAVVATVRDVTDRKTTESALADTRHQVDQLLGRVSDAFFALTPDWEVSYVNESGATVIRQAAGLEPDADVIGLHLWEAVPDVTETTFYEKYTEAMATQEPVSFVEHYEPMGVWFEVRAYPSENGLSVYFTDVTERRERKRELYIKERVMEEAAVPVSLADPSDPDTPLTYVNRAFEELTGYDREEIVGRNCRFLQGPETDPETTAAIRAAVDEERQIETEVRNYTADGEAFWNRLQVTPIYDRDGTLLRFLGTQSDVTEARRVRRVRERLLSTTRQLQSAEAEAAVAETVAAAARDVLGHEFAAVYLADDDGLTPAAWAGDGDDAPPESLPASAAATTDTGETAVVEAADDPAWPASSLAVPLADRGVLVVGETEATAFDDTDAELSELLAVVAGGALDRSRRTQELREYETLFETVEDKLYVVDADGYFRLVSAPLATALGYDREKLEGEHASLVTDAPRGEADHRLGADGVTDGGGNVHEGVLVARDGERLPVEVELSTLPGGAGGEGTVGAVRDISERRRRERELGAFREAITAAGVGVAVYDETGRIDYANEQYSSLLGEQRSATEGSRVVERFGHVDDDGFEAYWASFSPGETRRTEAELRRADGTAVPVELSTTAVGIDGEITHIQTAREITGRRQRRQQADALHRIIRHNLRNDLTVVLGHANRLAEELSGEHAEWAELIADTAAELVDLSQSVQDAERIVDRDTVRRPVDVVPMLETEAQAVRADHDVQFEASLPARQYVTADETLSVALRHLIENAAEHTPGTTTVELSVTPVPDRSGWVAVEVTDDGPGLPAHESRVLTNGEETPLEHGSGMGLWVVHWIVSRYGGELDFEVDDGTTVRLSLPAADPVPSDDVPGP